MLLLPEAASIDPSFPEDAASGSLDETDSVESSSSETLAVTPLSTEAFSEDALISSEAASALSEAASSSSGTLQTPSSLFSFKASSAFFFFRFQKAIGNSFLLNRSDPGQSG
ncbi:MAG: hypothetical protein PUG16_02445 [Lachnospiraceae bacterium]|nr:hypothetical protein [Lachnospiraceae bacterium]